MQCATRAKQNIIMPWILLSIVSVLILNQYCSGFSGSTTCFGRSQQQRPQVELFRNCKTWNPTTVKKRIYDNGGDRQSLMGMVPIDSIVNAATTTIASTGSSTILVSETEAWVQPFALVLDPFLNFMSFAMLSRVVLSWYPELDTNNFKNNNNITATPLWTSAVVVPTEPLLSIVKNIIPPAFGVDITPVFWLAVFTFVHEILLGQQGILTMKIKYGI